METNDVNKHVEKILYEFNYKESEYWYVRFAVDNNYKYLAVANDNGEIFVWNLDESDPQNIRKTVLTHKKSKTIIRQIAFSSDGNTLIAVSDDSCIYRWNIHPQI